MNAVEIKNLKKTYEGFTLENISLDVPKGTIMGLIGENGAGKSTTLKLIMGVIKRDEGSIKVLGVDNKSKEFVNIKEKVGAVFGECYFPEDFTLKHVDLLMKNAYKNWNTETFFMYGEKFQIKKSKLIKEYSKGMKIKLSIAVALSHEANLLILDEPTTDILYEFTRNEENSIIISSHIISDLEKICDYIAFIHKGKLVVSEEKDYLLEKYAILKLTKEQIEDLPEEAIVRKKEEAYGWRVLVHRHKIGDFYKPERVNLEEIILMLAGGENYA